jgi:DNA polymerase IV
LPGCGDRIAELWHHWKETGESVEVREANADPKISVLKVFYNIWGVGAISARDFYQKGEHKKPGITSFARD